MLVTITVSATAFPPEWLQSSAEITIGKTLFVLHLSVNPLYYNYSNLKERVICEALAPFPTKWLKFFALQPTLMMSEGLTWCPLWMTSFSRSPRTAANAFLNLFLAPEGFWSRISTFSFIVWGRYFAINVSLRLRTFSLSSS